MTALPDRLLDRLPLFWTRSLTLLILILVASVVSALTLNVLDFSWGDEGLSQFRAFAGSAFSPTLVSESSHGQPILPELVDATKTTILVAFAAMSLAVLGGFVLGCLASEAFWLPDPVVMESPWLIFHRRVVRPVFLLSLRSFMALTRSIHEMFWALLGVALFCLIFSCGILAIAIPYAATLGRIYAELLDETERDGARALRDCGSSRFGIFAFGLLPRAASTMLSYTFYRFDCALRSSAILGFIGFPTLGLSIRSAVRYSYYREAWTFLYVLFAILVATESLSGVLRRRLAAWR